MRVAAALLAAALLCACTTGQPPASAGQSDLHPELRILRGMEFVPNG
jgi:hypothetical protein